jgi:hypothetical protein
MPAFAKRRRNREYPGRVNNRRYNIGAGSCFYWFIKNYTHIHPFEHFFPALYRAAGRILVTIYLLLINFNKE